MFDHSPHFTALPCAPGVGYKPQHFNNIIKKPAPVEWLEIHAENYMGAGGRPLAQLHHLAERFAISVHGVGLSIGGEGPLDTAHLLRLKGLCDWLQPASFSEHLAWSSHDNQFLNDLLPLPYTESSLTRIVDHIDQVQNALGYQMLLENPSSYLAFEDSTLSEPEFLTQITKQSGCGLLLDVNNVFISATNLSFNPQTYINQLPLAHVAEIHIGGHDEQADEDGEPLLIDSHGCPVADPVWALLDYVLASAGPRPVLVEWDTDVPDWSLLAAEANRAANALSPVLV